MLKTIGLIILVVVILVMFVTPIRNYCNNLLYKDKSELNEAQIIGTFSGYSPRVEEIQRILKDAHFDPGPADGVMGSQTRKAIREFQKEKGLWPSSKVDSKTWLELSREKEALKKETTVQTLVFPSEKYPGDVKSEEETARIREPQEKVAKARLPKDRKKQIQIALQKAGFYKGKIDGKIGPQTKEAIKAFQKAKGLKTDGAVGAQTWVELNKYLKE
ncbi:MAG: peptidoglycan-binding protein [Candidatus Omnitrophota bacterium]|jgi:peptidoglycan hydrolase-like protein with peptidoglycan-binding domain|nr:MAG: peptidoglycan-binding protein [Candidatus Omnitrophota bacterium]